MKHEINFSRPFLFFLVSLVTIVFVATSFFVGYYFKGENIEQTSKTVETECPYSQGELNAVLAKIENTDWSPTQQEAMGAPAPIDKRAIKALEGECADEALDNAYDLGIRDYRDLTTCWPKCVVTKDLRGDRLDFAIENRRMIHMSVS